MANFNKAFDLTSIAEGGYAFNEDDRGGETFRGIARKFWPNWGGWKIIDQIKLSGAKTASQINAIAKSNTLLISQISLFYKQNFWDINKLDLFTDQQLANTVYDFGVNAGPKKAAKTLQNVLSITQDGIVGNITISLVNSGNPVTIYAAYNSKRKEYYGMLAANPTQHQFLKSWLSRLKPYV